MLRGPDSPFSRRIALLFAGSPLPPLLLSLADWVAAQNPTLTENRVHHDQARWPR